MLVFPKFTVHDQFGVLVPQFLTEGTSWNNLNFKLKLEELKSNNANLSALFRPNLLKL